MKKANVRRSRRHDIAGKISGKKSLAVDERKVVDLARLRILIGNPRLRIWRRDLHQLMIWNDQFRVQKSDLLSQIAFLTELATVPERVKQHALRPQCAPDQSRSGIEKQFQNRAARNLQSCARLRSFSVRIRARPWDRAAISGLAPRAHPRNDAHARSLPLSRFLQPIHRASPARESR